MSDFLKLEMATAAWFWLPYLWPSGFSTIDRWPLLSLLWFGVWISSPLVTLVGALMVRRASRQRLRWLQIAVGLALAASVWFQCSRMEFC